MMRRWQWQGRAVSSTVIAVLCWFWRSTSPALPPGPPQVKDGVSLPWPSSPSPLLSLPPELRTPPPPLSQMLLGAIYIGATITRQMSFPFSPPSSTFLHSPDPPPRPPSLRLHVGSNTLFPHFYVAQGIGAHFPFFLIISQAVSLLPLALPPSSPQAARLVIRTSGLLFRHPNGVSVFAKIRSLSAETHKVGASP